MATTDEQTNDVLSFGSEANPKVEKPESSLNPDIGLESTIRESFPEYAGQNAFHLRKKLVEDDDFFEEVSQKFFSSTMTEQESKALQEDPNALQDRYNTFKKNFRKQLTDKAYSGETPDETLIKRSVEAVNDPSEIPTSDYLDIMKSNKKKYQKLGLLNSDGTFVYEGDMGSFEQAVLSSPELHKQIETDRYNQFKRELGKSHNTADFFDNPRELTRAWVVYDKLGSEGLTQYVNAYQTLADASILDKESKLQEARNYLSGVKIGGKTLDQYMNKFVIGEVEGVKYGDLIAKSSYKHGLDAATLTGLVEQESSFNPEAISKTGAVGLTQLQPATAREQGLKVPDELYELDVKRIKSQGAERKKWAEKLRKRTEELGVDPEKDERYVPEKALEATGKYLSKAQKTFKNDDLTIASYHMGVSGAGQAFENLQERWKEGIPDSTRSYIEKVRKNQGKYKEKVDQGLTFRPKTKNKELTTDIPKDLNGYTQQFYKKNGENVDQEYGINKFVKENFPDLYKEKFSMSTLKKDGQFSEEYRNLTYSIYEKAIEGDKYSMEDLQKTVLANSSSVESAKGRPSWRVDYKTLDWKQRLAFDALMQDNDMEYLFEHVGNKVYKFRPQRRENAADSWRNVRNWFYDTKTVAKQTPEGETVFEEVPETDFFGQAWNSLVTLGMAGASEVMQYGFTPLARISDKVFNTETTNRLVEVTKELSGVNPASDLTTTDEDGAWVAGVGEVAPFAMYMASMMGIGKMAVKGAATTAKALTGGKRALDSIRLGRQMKGSPRFAAMAEKLSNAVRNKHPWATGAGIFYSGGAIKEALAPEEHSFHNIVPRFLGYKPTNSLSKLYNTSNDATQIGMDIAGSLALDMFADTLIASTRFLGSKAGQKWFNKKEFKSITWGENGWKVQDTPAFKHDLREFWHNISADLASKPMGEVGEAMAKDFTKGARISTVHDVAKVFSDNVSEVTGDMKSEIRQNINFVQKHLGDGTRLSNEQIDQLVEQNYQRFIDNTATSLKQIMDASDDEGLSLRFAQALEEQTPSTKEFTINGEKISPEEAGYWKEQGHNLVVKGDKVYKIDDKFWALDVAQSIRKKYFSDPNVEKIQNRKVKEAGIDDAKYKNAEEAERAAQIRQRTRDIIGTPVKAGERLGYIVDYDDKGFIARTSQGDVRVNRFENLEEGYLDNIKVEQGLDKLQAKQATFRQTQEGMSKLSEAERKAKQRPTGEEMPVVEQGQILYKQIPASAPRRKPANIAETQTETIDDLLNRNVRYGEYEGRLARDQEGNYIVETADDTMVELPIQKVGGIHPRQVGVQPKLRYDPESGSVIMGDEILRFKKGMNSFEFDEVGNPIKARFDRAGGGQRVIDDRRLVEEMYDQRMLQEGVDNPVRSKIMAEVEGRLEFEGLRKRASKFEEYAKEIERITKIQDRIPFC